MAKIRLDERTRKEYEKVRRNAKAKLNRVKKTYGLDLTDKIDLPKLEDFSTRNEFNDWVEKTSSFTNRANTHYQFVKNDYGVVADKHTLYEIDRDVKKAQRLVDRKTEELREKPFIAGGKEQGTVGQQMLQMKEPTPAGMSRPLDFDFSKVRNSGRLKKISQNMKKKSNPQYYNEKNKIMRDNFIKILDLSFNSDADDIVNELKKMNPDDFFEMYMQHGEFEFALYDSEGQDVTASEAQLEKIRTYIKAYHNGDEDLDYKGI